MGLRDEKFFANDAQVGRLLNALPIAVVIYASDLSVVYANQMAQKVLGSGFLRGRVGGSYPGAYQLYKTGTDQAYPREQLPAIRALRGEYIAVDDITLYRDEIRVPIEAYASPIFDEIGRITHAIVAFQDITVRKQAEQVLSDYNQHLREQAQEGVLALEQEILERQKTEMALRQSEAQNRAILTAIPDLMFRVSAEGVYLGYIRTNAFIDLLPRLYDPVGRHMSEYLPSEVVERQMRYIQQALLTGQLQVYEQQNWIKGRLQYEEVRVVPCGSQEVLFMIRDITAQQAALLERKEAEAAFRKSEVTNRALLQAIPDLLIRMRRDGTYLSFINNGELSIFNAERIIENVSIYDVLPLDKAKERMSYVEQAFLTGKMQVYEYQLMIRGKLQDEEARLIPMTHDEILIVVRDISDRKRAESERRQAEQALRRAEAELRQANEELERLANTDALTQLANRRCFDDRLVQEWHRFYRQHQPISLILFDVDCFKRYNDHYGHPAGDECLVQIAWVAQQVACRSTDLVARHGGEEFAVILPGTDLQGAIVIASQLRTAVEELAIPHAQSDASPFVTISLGLTSLVPDDQSVPDTLITQADQALYWAKQQGRNRYVIYDESNIMDE